MYVCMCVCMYVCVYVCSCVALSDLLSSRQIGEVVDYIPRLWELVLRVRDDIKVIGFDKAYSTGQAATFCCAGDSEESC